MSAFASALTMRSVPSGSAPLIKRLQPDSSSGGNAHELPCLPIIENGSCRDVYIPHGARGGSPSDTLLKNVSASILFPHPGIFYRPQNRLDGQLIDGHLRKFSRLPQPDTDKGMLVPKMFAILEFPPYPSGANGATETTNANLSLRISSFLLISQRYLVPPHASLRR